MARVFDRSSSQYLLTTSSPITTTPMTMACWWYTTDATVDQYLIACQASSGHFNALIAYGTDADRLQAYTWDGSGATAKASYAFSTNTWHHGAAVFAAGDDRRVFMDGGYKGTSSASQTPDSLTRIGIAANSFGSSGYLAGGMAEVAIWNATLSDEAIAVLSTGVSPLAVHPQDLVIYLPFVRDDDNCLISGISFTPGNSPTVGAHPRVIYPKIFAVNYENIVRSDALPAYLEGVVDARISQLAVEVLVKPNPKARVSQFAVELLYENIVRSDALPAYMEGSAPPERTSFEAYMEGESTAVVSQVPVEVLVKPDDQAGRVSQAPVEVLVKPDDQAARVSQAPVEVLLENVERGSMPAYMDAVEQALASLPAYLVTATKVEVAQAIAYAETEQKKLVVAQAIAYAETEQKKLVVAQAIAYAEILEAPGTDTSDSFPAYLTGIVRDDTPAYLKGQANTSTDLSAYMFCGTSTSDSVPTYMFGRIGNTSSLSAFMWAALATSTPAYLSGGYSAVGSLGAYLKGKQATQSSLSAWLASGYRFSSLSAWMEGYQRTSLSAYLYCGTKSTSSLGAFTKAEVNTTTSLSAYTASHIYTATTRPAYLMCGIAKTWKKSAFLKGEVNTLAYKRAYLRGKLSTTDSLDAYIKAGTAASDTQTAYLNAVPKKVSSYPVFLEGTVNFERTSLDAYTDGILGAAYLQSAYLRGGINPTTSFSAYMVGGINPVTSLDAYLYGRPLSTLDAYTRGLDSNTWSLDAYTEGWGTETGDGISAYLEGKYPGVTYTPAYLEGWPAYFPDPVDMPAYLSGTYAASDFYGKVWIHGKLDATPSNLDAHLYGGLVSTSGIPAYCRGIVENFRGSMKAFIGPPVERSSLHCSTEGLVVEQAYIILENSDDSLSKYFRVVAQGYDDGMLEKSSTVTKTIGGGVDVSMGDVYTTWNPLIRVRHTEPESGFGTLADLVTFYGYNDPGGTPTNVITFTDNHGTEHSVYMVGDFKKQYIGAEVEGDQAWLFVRLKLVEKV